MTRILLASDFSSHKELARRRVNKPLSHFLTTLLLQVTLVKGPDCYDMNTGVVAMI